MQLSKTSYYSDFIVYPAVLVALAAGALMHATWAGAAEWLAKRRFGGDEEVASRGFAQLAERRDAVLDRAALAPGETLLDVGCGEGLIGFGALDPRVTMRQVIPGVVLMALGAQTVFASFFLGVLTLRRKTG